MKKLSRFLLVSFALFIGLQSLSCDEVLDFIWKRVVLCTVNPNPENCNSTSGGSTPGGEYGGDEPDTTQSCGQIALRVWVAGKVEVPMVTSSYIWANLEYQGKEIQSSESIHVMTDFFGYYLHIPLGGLQLNPEEYTISIYACESEVDVGDRKKSEYRITDAYRYTFTQAQVSDYQSRPRVQERESLYDQRICAVPIGEFIELTVNHTAIDSIEILDGTQPTPQIKWEVGGAIADAGIITHADSSWSYIFIAMKQASLPGDCFIVATDTSDTSVVPDTIGIMIIPCATSDCCNPGRFHAGVQIGKSAGPELTGLQYDVFTKYGEKMCGPPDDTKPTVSLIWGSVVNDNQPTSTGKVWGQS
ncbi:MAG: hypothetical protein IID16_12825, partial [Candidatus Marinimicrobia bacterium]|nr:hypothetical protein [Candidatus Neomarinimicrobiota bacterium]